MQDFSPWIASQKTWLSTDAKEQRRKHSGFRDDAIEELIVGGSTSGGASIPNVTTQNLILSKEVSYFRSISNAFTRRKRSERVSTTWNAYAIEDEPAPDPRGMGNCWVGSTHGSREVKMQMHGHNVKMTVYFIKLSVCKTGLVLDSTELGEADTTGFGKQSTGIPSGVKKGSCHADSPGACFDTNAKKKVIIFGASDELEESWGFKLSSRRRRTEAVKNGITRLRPRPRLPRPRLRPKMRRAA